VDQKGKAPPTVREDQDWDHLRNVNKHKSTGPDKMHPRVLRELADVIAKPLSIAGKSRQSGEFPGDWKRETFCTFFKSIERRTLGTTDLSASPLCLGRSWNRSS